MNLSHLAVQLVVAIACAAIANVVIPREIPGKFVGFIVTGLLGVWVGEAAYKFVRVNYGINSPFLNWGIEGVPILPSITAVFTATEYSLIWRMLDLLGFPGLALYLILGRFLTIPGVSGGRLVAAPSSSQGRFNEAQSPASQ